MGTNGHLGLNEPALFAHPYAHVHPLAPSTLSHGMLAGMASAPTHGITMGIREVLSAREILLIIRGAGKEAAASALRNGLVDPQWPITFLLLHDSVTVLQGA